MHMASAISAEPEKKVKVITNSILLAEKLLDHTHVELIMIGGEVACNLAATEGSTAYAQLGKLRADRAFIGRSPQAGEKHLLLALSPSHTVTDEQNVTTE